jgi:serine/threonine protein kinase
MGTARLNSSGVISDIAKSKSDINDYKILG